MIKLIDNKLLAVDDNVINDDPVTKKVSSVTGRTISYADGNLYIAGKAGGLSENKITVIDSKTYSLVKTIPFNGSYIAAYDTDMDLLYVGNIGSTQGWDILDGSPPYSVLKSYRGGGVSGFRVITIDDNSNRIFFVRYAGTVHVVDRTTLSTITILSPSGAGLSGCVLDIDNDLIYFSSLDVSYLGMYKYSDLSYVGLADQIFFRVYGFVNQNNINEILTCSFGSTVRVLDKRTLVVKKSIVASAHCITQDQDGNIIYINDTTGIFKIII